MGAVGAPEVRGAAGARAGVGERPGVATRNRRTWVVDSERGVVVDFAVLDVANEEGATAEARAQTPATSTGPYSLLTATLYKMAGDAATVAANATLVVPYGMGSRQDQ